MQIKDDYDVLGTSVEIIDEDLRILEHLKYEWKAGKATLNEADVYFTIKYIARYLTRKKMEQKKIMDDLEIYWGNRTHVNHVEESPEILAAQEILILLEKGQPIVKNGNTILLQRLYEILDDSISYYDNMNSNNKANYHYGKL